MDELLGQPTRRRLYDLVRAHPGASARDLQRRAGLAWGETAYHLDQLTRAGAIRREKGGRRDYYFPPGITWEDRKLLSALRSPAERRILLELSQHPELTLTGLGAAAELSPSTTSFHVRHLIGAGLVEGLRTENVRRYRVVHPSRVAEIVREYRESFEDRLVDRFVLAWSSIFR